MTYEELLEYLKLVPQAATDPAFYSIMATGLDPQQAAAQNISGQNQLLQSGAGALGGLAAIGNTFGNAVDPLARAAESYFGPVTLGGLLPTVDQARQTRDEGAANYNALYGGSIPSAIGKNIVQDAVLGPIARAGGVAVGEALPSIAAGFNKLLGSGRLGQVGGGAAAGSANALLGTGLFASDSEQPFVDQLLQNAIFGAGFGGLGGVAGNQGPLWMAGSNDQPPLARPVGPGYYGLEDAVLKGEGAPKAATADKWLQWVNGAQARGQLSKEERADVGLDDWLEEKAATGEKVTREEIQQFVTENTPQLKVVVPGGGIDSHELFNIQQMADSDAQRSGMESVITAIDDGRLDGYAGLPSVKQLVDFYEGDSNRLSMDADLITSRVGMTLANGLTPSADDVTKARQFYDAFALAEDVEGASPSMSFEEFVAEAGKEGADAYNQAFKKTFPNLWSNTYYDNALDALKRAAPNEDVRLGMANLYNQNTSDKARLKAFTKIVSDPVEFDRVLGPYAVDVQGTMEDMRGIIAREQYNPNRSMKDVEDMLADTMGFGAINSLRNYTNDQALDAVANRFLKEKPRYEYYQWDKGNARDYHERIVQLETPYDNPEAKVKRAKELGYTVRELSDAARKTVGLDKDTYAIVPPGENMSVAYSNGATPEEALENWARTTATRTNLKFDTPYKHAHWDEENPVAHWRANVRDTLVDDGVPSYHIEEVQSDWHQQAGTAAREATVEGYTGYRLRPGSVQEKTAVKKAEARAAELREKAKKFDEEREVIRQTMKAQSESGSRRVDPDVLSRYGNLQMQVDSLYREANNLDFVTKNKNTGYPDAPFKRSWEQLTFKSALKEAVDRGLTRISWTPGQLQSTATGQEKNRKGNDERYNKRLVNIANDLGKKYGTKVQMQPIKLSLLPSDGPVAPQAFDLSIPEQSQFAMERSDQYPFVIFKPDSESKSRGASLEQGKYYVNMSQNWWNKAAEKQSTRDLVLKAADYNYSKTGKSYDTFEEAKAAAEAAYKDVVPKVPYMNLTPRMIEDVKNGRLKLY